MASTTASRRAWSAAGSARSSPSGAPSPASPPGSPACGASSLRAARAARTLEWDAEHGLYKVSPLLDWSEAQVWQYIRAHGLPYNPLHDRQYPEHRLLAVHPGHPARREPPRGTLVVGATRVARMRPASQSSARRPCRPERRNRCTWIICRCFCGLTRSPPSSSAAARWRCARSSGCCKAGARVTVVAPAAARGADRAASTARGASTCSAPSSPHSSRACRSWSPPRIDRAVNAAVRDAARARNIPVNVVDDPQLSTFIFPAIIDRSPLLVAVSSAGASPVLARHVREQIEALLPARLGALARFMGAAAPGRAAARWAAWRGAPSGSALSAALPQRACWPATRRRAAQRLRKRAAHLAAHQLAPRAQRHWARSI